MLTDLPICIKCKHFLKVDRGRVCAKTAEMDLVTGETTYLFCSTVRESNLPMHCGVNGQFYEQNIGEIHDDE